MHNSIMRSGLIVLLPILWIYGCSIKEIRSPIVFRSPVVLEKTDAEETPEQPTPSIPSEKIAVAKAEEVSPPTAHQPQGALAPQPQGEKPLPTNQEPSEKLITQEARSEISEKEASREEVRGAFPLEKIRILSSDEVYHLKFKILGKVSAREKKQGFTEEEAIKELKIQAIKTYGNQAKGLTTIGLVKKQKIFYYTKGRRDISTPKEPDTYEKASAEVVFWE